MYATCMFCKQPLGANESFETFPVGERLAFDAAKGRLWVVCPKCERWNLSPMEERWEAIDHAEKLYRDSRRRVATDNIGLAKLPDGTTIVRIGVPQRPEFAAWRYGDQFGRRRRRQMLVAGGGVAALGAVVAGGAFAGVSLGAFGWIIAKSATSIVRGSPEAVVARIRTADGRMLHVRRRHLAATSLSQTPEGELAIELRFKNGADRFEGREAHRIASIVVPKVNRFGGSKEVVSDAVREIEAVGSADAYLARLSRISLPYRQAPDPLQPWWRKRESPKSDFSKYGLFALPSAQRLALEMALHEESERRALEGELGELERAWQEAEEIAAISDDMFLPSAVMATIDRLKGKA